MNIPPVDFRTRRAAAVSGAARVALLLPLLAVDALATEGAL
jgi:hypothetical protein